jgi:CRISPR/Cas system CSM-associated protein Csm2 small subunit
MYLNDLKSTTESVAKLNSVLADTFGHSIDLAEMSTDALGRMLTATNQKMMAIKESDMAYWENPQYNKLNLIQHQLRTYINEVAPARTDGKKMKKQKTLESKLMEDELASAEVLLASQELVDKLQKMVEDVAEMQVQELMPIVDAMKSEVGFDVAEAYNTAADAALGGLLDQMKAAKDQLEDATLAAQGKAPNRPAPTPMAAEPETGDMDMDILGDPGEDDFGGVDSAADDESGVGRELKSESVFDRMEKKALKEARVLEAKRKVLEAAKAAGFTKSQYQKLLKSI